ncbi:dehydrogenase [Mesorhizobium hawassense]|uniref:Dehydrogenase n=2 Tax=Mesorhizobium hawassense TaxID=1209954 RepID=A0A330HMQ2_9HYPH|nr:dehydrogenase [Mesorhizobium hawassense]
MQRTSTLDMPDSDVTDVIVVGTGAAALTAALTAAVGGKTVRIIEKTTKIGGTSAMSGGLTWVPANPQAAAAGASDTPEEALEYIRATAPAGWAEAEDKLWESMVHAGPAMLDLVDRHSLVRFKVANIADPFMDKPGAKAWGRVLTLEPISKKILGRYRRSIRRSTLPQRITVGETVAARIDRQPVRGMLRCMPTLVHRWFTDSIAQGNALIVGLLKGCLNHGCRIHLSTRALSLVTDPASGAVRGVEVEHDGTSETYYARLGVVLATGGFEWNAQMLAEYYPSEVDFLSSPSSNEGDGHRMAKAAGAAFAHMDQGNVVIQPPIRYEGELHGLPLRIHAEPDAIIVDKAGRRFASEYEYWVYDRIMERDEAGELRYQPAWVISHWPMVKRTPLIRYCRLFKSGWLVTAQSLEKLAERTGLPAANLVETVSRFNGFARSGKDADFGRGESLYEQELAKSLGLMQEIARPPFVAYRFKPSLLGTKGGVRTNHLGQALRADGSVIDGLYCCGNVMASPTGAKPPSQGGTTIGSYMTWGYICSMAIIRSSDGHVKK